MNRLILQRCGVHVMIAVVMAGAASSPVGAQAEAQAQATSAPIAGAAVDDDSQSPPQEMPHRFEDLLRVALRDRKLQVTLILPKSLDQPLRAGHSADVSIIDSDVSDWRISDTGRAAHDPDRAYDRFTLEPPSYHRPDRWSPLQLTGVTADGALTLTGAGRVGRTFVTVTYRQEGELNAARLTVERSRRPGAGRPLHDCRGSDVLELWNNHQREMRTYLVPLLRTIAPRENLLRPRAGDVYRVFNEIPADPEAIARVVAILPEFQSTSPAAREAASAKVEALGPGGVLAILRMDRSQWTPEQSARLGAIVQRDSTLADPISWRSNIYFLTDCLADPDPAVRQAALDAVRAIAGREVEFDPDAAPQARLAAAAQVLRTLESRTTTTATTATGR